MDGPDTPSTALPRVKLSDQARRDVESHSVQDFGGDEWIEDRRPGSPGQGQRQGRQQGSEADGQSQFASTQPHRAPALQGGVSSTVENFGPKGSIELQGLGEQAALLLNVRTNPNPSFPAPKTVSPALYKSWLEQTHPELKAVDNKSAIIEVKGQWDDSGHVLHYFGLPSTRLNSNVVNKFDFSHSYVAIVDCAGNLNQDAVEALRSFVWNGGYLVSTDWALDNFVVKAFPGAIEWNGGYSYPDLVDAICVDLNTEYLKGCVPAARWKLDDKCQTVKIVKPAYVHVLVRSRMLSRQDPDGFGVLAVTFQYGKGQVLHVVGHFDINSAGTFTNSLPDPAPRIGIGLRQAIIANFIVKGLQAHEAGSTKPDGDKAASESGNHPGDSQTQDAPRKKKTAQDMKPSEQNSSDPKLVGVKSPDLKSPEMQPPDMQPPDMQLHDAEPPDALPIMER